LRYGILAARVDVAREVREELTVEAPSGERAVNPVRIDGGDDRLKALWGAKISVLPANR